MSSLWHATEGRADPRGLPVANRHYNRQNPDSPQYVKPGRCVVLLTRAADALWVTSWPYAEYVRHAWAGAWECSTFRNEGPVRSLAKYAASPLVRAIVFVVERNMAANEDAAEGKPVHYVSLTQNWGVA